MPNPAYSNLIQTQTTPISPTSCEEPIDFVVNDSKYEQLNNNLNTKVKALKPVILEQLSVIMKTIEVLRFKTEKHRFPAAVFPSDASQGKLHGDYCEN